MREPVILMKCMKISRTKPVHILWSFKPKIAILKDRPTHPPFIEAMDLMGMLVYISVSGAGDLRGRAVCGVATEVKYFYFMFQGK